MIITTEKEQILGNGSKSSAFTIQASPKVFKILSSDLYTNKVRAVVRELITNMIDAHHLNGYEGKFKVYCPGRLDPRFVCRDFGPGMSDFDIRGDENSPGLYNSYFSSSKAESNDFIGGFGLGSKSPFSYTDTFSITSYHKGEIRGYVAYMDGDGPQIKPTFVKPMGPDDKTGIEVVVPVEEKDFHRFSDEIAYIMRPFKDQADIYGLDREINYFPEFDDYYAVQNTPYHYPEHSGIYALYGGIVYPLDGVFDYRSNWMSIRNDVVYVKFPMGSLDIAPSREALSIDDRTRHNIIERIEKLDAEILEEETKKWVESDNIRQTYRDLNQLNYSARDFLLRNRGKNVKFTKYKLTYEHMYKMFDVKTEYCNAGVVYNINFDPRLKRLKYSAESSVTASVSRMFGIEAKKINIVYDDAKNRVNMVRGLYEALGDSKFVQKHDLKLRRGENLLFISPESEFQVDMIPSILELFDGDEVVFYKTSELIELVKDYIPKPESKSRGPRPKTPSMFKWSKENGQWKKEDLFTLASEVHEISGYAVLMYRNDYQALSDGTQLLHPSSSILNLMADIADVTEYYVVRPTLHNKIRSLGNCECLMSACRENMINALDDVNYDEYIGYSYSAERYINKIVNYPELEFMLKYFTSQEVTSQYSRLANIVNLMRGVYFSGNNPTGRDIRNVIDIFETLRNNASRNSDKMVQDFHNKFKMVSEYITRRSDLDTTDVDQIVKTMKALAA